MTLCDKVRLEEGKLICTSQSCVYKLPEGKCMIDYTPSSDFAVGVNAGKYENNKSAD